MFKQFILGAVATATLATPMVATTAEAQHRTVTTVQQRHNGAVVTRTVSRQQPPRAWRKGQRFDRRYAPNYRQIDYRQYRGRHLYAPPRGYHWVRSGNDAVLVAVTGGVIAAVMAGALR